MTEPVTTLSYAAPKVVGRSPRARWWLGLLRRLVWCILGMIGVSMLVGLVSLGSRLLMFWTGPAVVILLLITSYSAQRIRRWRAVVILSYLEQAVRANYPISQWLLAAAQSEKGAVRRRLLRLIDALRMGVDLADAVELTVLEATRRQVAVIRSAERAGRLRDGLSRLVRDERRLPPDDITTCSMVVAYPMVVTLLLVGAVGLLMIFVIPKYQQMLLDFGVAMPWASRMVIEVARTVGLPIWVIAVVMFVLVIGRAFEAMFFVIPQTLPPWWRITDRLSWFLPIWRAPSRWRQLADLCDATAAGLQSGLPFERALADASSTATNSVLRRRVKHWGELLESGQNIHHAARAAAMPALMVGMLATANQAAQAADVLRFLARYYETRFSRIRSMIHGAVIPVMVLVAGALVLLVMAGLFMPMVDLINMMEIDYFP